MFTLPKLADTAERVLSSFAGALLAFVTATGDLLNLTAVNWGEALSVSGAAALVSLLKAIVAANVGERGTAALLPSTGRHARRD